MNSQEMIQVLQNQTLTNCEIEAVVKCIDDIGFEDDILYSLMAIFKHNLKYKPIFHHKSVIVSGSAADIVDILSNNAYAKFFDYTNFIEHVSKT